MLQYNIMGSVIWIVTAMKKIGLIEKILILATVLNWVEGRNSNLEPKRPPFHLLNAKC
jgi:hypothetical protein